jgi:hypothetical protein
LQITRTKEIVMTNVANGEPWFDSRWENDFQGKKTGTATLVSVFLRYYPASYSANGKPSCSASLDLGDLCIREAKIEGDTEAEVITAAERWAATEADAIRSAILANFTPKA